MNLRKVKNKEEEKKEEKKSKTKPDQYHILQKAKKIYPAYRVTTPIIELG